MSVDELLQARDKAIEEEKQRFFDVRRQDGVASPARSSHDCRVQAGRRGEDISGGVARITKEDLGPGKVLSYKKARLSKHHEHIIDVRAANRQQVSSR